MIIRPRQKLTITERNILMTLFLCVRKGSREGKLSLLLAGFFYSFFLAGNKVDLKFTEYRDFTRIIIFAEMGRIERERKGKNMKEYEIKERQKEIQRQGEKSK